MKLKIPYSYYYYYFFVADTGHTAAVHVADIVVDRTVVVAHNFVAGVAVVDIVVVDLYLLVILSCLIIF